MLREIAKPNDLTPRERFEAAQERLRLAVTEVHAAASEVQYAQYLVQREQNKKPDREHDGAIAYRISEVAKKIGLSRDMVKKEISKGALPTVRVGTAVLILHSDLMTYLKQRRSG